MANQLSVMKTMKGIKTRALSLFTSKHVRDATEGKEHL
jgi:hypothetical protein